MTSGITDILGSFSVSQLRDLAFAMTSHGIEAPRQGASKDDLLEMFKRKKSDAALTTFAHKIEAVSPYKHLFVYSLDAGRFTFKEAAAQIEAAFPGLLKKTRDVSSPTRDLEPEACVLDENQNRIYLKLVHQVEMSGWVAVSRTEKKLREFKRRHPVVATFRPSDGLMTISFPGFTYAEGVQHEERVVYADIAARGAAFIKSILKIDCAPYIAKPAIDALLEEEPNEVTDIKRSIRPLKGGRFAFDAGEEGKLAVAITDFLSREGDIPVNEVQIRRLLRKSGASDIVLVWKQLKIVTRVALLQEAPEFLFIWREAGRSSYVVDAVLRKVAAYGKLVRVPGIATARSEVLRSPLDDVVRPTVVAQHYGITFTDAVQILSLAVAKGDFEPRFRANTDSLLLDFSNTWRKTLAEFPTSVVAENGEILDLTKPSNIEVAFQRVR
jgi:hypothetical protein